MINFFSLPFSLTLMICLTDKVQHIKMYIYKFIYMNNSLQRGKVNLSKLTQVDPSKINKSQLNSSSSKMQYSVPKQQRWKERKEDKSPFYEIPDTKSKRSASFGYGKKMQIGKVNFHTPSVGEYHLRSQFVEDKKKGVTISAGRQIVKNNSIFDTQYNKVPGPGNYNIENNEKRQKAKGYSLSSRNIDITDKWIKSVPGPGNYETLELLDKNLKTINSKVTNVKAGRWGKKERQSQFEAKQKLKIPGPAQCKLLAMQDEKGESLERLKYQKKGGYRFGTSKREGIVGGGRGIPGPGAQYLQNYVVLLFPSLSIETCDEICGIFQFLFIKIFLIPKSNMKNSERKILHLGKPRKSCHEPSQKTLPTMKCVKTYIGAPFQIRIPSNEMNFLLSQVKCLKEKCSQLEKNLPQENLQEVVSSLKQIENDINMATSDSNFCRIKKDCSRKNINESILTCNTYKKTSETRYTEVLTALRSAENEIDKLEGENDSMIKKIKDKKESLQNINKECEALKEKINNKI